VEADVPPVERARIRIHEAFALVKATPVEETRRLLEEGITLFEQQEGLVSFVSIDATDAVWLYAAVAHTPEQRTRAVGWLRQALPLSESFYPTDSRTRAQLTSNSFGS